MANEIRANRPSTAHRGEHHRATGRKAVRASRTTGSVKTLYAIRRQPTGSIKPILKEVRCRTIRGSRSQKKKYNPADAKKPVVANRANSFHRRRTSKPRLPAAKATTKVYLNWLAKPAAIPAKIIAHGDSINKRRIASKLKKMPGKSPRRRRTQLHMLLIDKASMVLQNQARGLGMSARAIEATAAIHRR
jgi:hypothetical protein